MGKLLHLILPFMMLFGFLLVLSGLFTASSPMESHPSDTQIVIIYPRFLDGAVIGIIGVVVMVFSYLIVYN